jgi:hypothetical protein
VNSGDCKERVVRAFRHSVVGLQWVGLGEAPYKCTKFQASGKFKTTTSISYRNSETLKDVYLVN